MVTEKKSATSANKNQMGSDRREYQREYMRRYREKHPAKYAAYKRRKVLQYAETHARVPTKNSVVRYNIQCGELSKLFISQINTLRASRRRVRDNNSGNYDHASCGALYSQPTTVSPQSQRSESISCREHHTLQAVLFYRDHTHPEKQSTSRPLHAPLRCRRSAAQLRLRRCRRPRCAMDKICVSRQARARCRRDGISLIDTHKHTHIHTIARVAPRSAQPRE